MAVFELEWVEVSLIKCPTMISPLIHSTLNTFPALDPPLYGTYTTLTILVYSIRRLTHVRLPFPWYPRRP
jgi:hypothetical protein